MNSASDELSKRGYVILDDIVKGDELEFLIECCESKLDCKVGTRNLLQNDWVESLGNTIRHNPRIAKLLPKDAITVQCNYFSKDTTNNWYVTSHRDLSIPVDKKIDSDQWSGWSTKEGVLYAQPPREVLESLLIVRIHLEHNNYKNGALHVVPGSHLFGTTELDEIICNVNKGGALLMSPLILHKSPKLQFGTRRVLHFVFGPRNLPDGAKWPQNSIQKSS